MNRLTLWILVSALALPVACSTPTGSQEEVIVLEVAPDRVACVGELEGECLQVRSPGEEEWRTFYDPIEGFEPEVGVQYTLEVARREVLNPLADGSAYAYRLLRILEEVPVGG